MDQTELKSFPPPACDLIHDQVAAEHACALNHAEAV